MTSRLTFNPADQRGILGAADSIVTDLEHLLPKVPWFSNSGQQDAFRNTVQNIWGQTTVSLFAILPKNENRGLSPISRYFFRARRT